MVIVSATLELYSTKITAPGLCINFVRAPLCGSGRHHYTGAHALRKNVGLPQYLLHLNSEIKHELIMSRFLSVLNTRLQCAELLFLLLLCFSHFPIFLLSFLHYDIRLLAAAAPYCLQKIPFFHSHTDWMIDLLNGV